MTKVALGLGILLLVACGSVTAADAVDTPVEAVLDARVETVAQSEPVPTRAVVQAQDTADVGTLRQRVAELEARLRWTEAEAIAVVQFKLWEAVNDCGRGHSHYGSITQIPGGGVDVGRPTGCIEREAYKFKPVLRTFRFGKAFPANQVPYLGGIMLTEGEWSAVHDPDNLRWRVTVVRRYAAGPIRLHFVVYERTGLVEGTDPPAQQTP